MSKIAAIALVLVPFAACSSPNVFRYWARQDLATYEALRSCRKVVVVTGPMRDGEWDPALSALAAEGLAEELRARGFERSLLEGEKRGGAVEVVKILEPKDRASAVATARSSGAEAVLFVSLRKAQIRDGRRLSYDGGCLARVLAGDREALWEYSSLDHPPEGADPSDVRALRMLFDGSMAEEIDWTAPDAQKEAALARSWGRHLLHALKIRKAMSRDIAREPR